jgi:hypothetical protein
MKRYNFYYYKKIIELVSSKEHLTNEGFQKIIYLKSLFSKGLNYNLNEIYDKSTNVIIPIIKPPININPYWLS